MNIAQIINLVIEWSRISDTKRSGLDVEISPDCKEFKIMAVKKDEYERI